MVVAQNTPERESLWTRPQENCVTRSYFSQKLHLPPELSETANRAQEDSDMPSKVSRVQGSSMGEQRAKVTVAKKKHNIDF